MMSGTESGGFSDNPFMIGYDNRIFEGDSSLGFKFPQDKVISKGKFVSLNMLIQEIKDHTGYPVFLNIGDSSTSGWDSNKIFKGNQNPNAPFFSYKTYSQLLEEQLFANVINAGIPGYTSYQGKKYLEILMKKLALAKISIDYITIYFGNNDCTYNQYEDKVRIDFKKSSLENKGERVTLKDFKKNLIKMIEIIREYGVKPVLIVPPVNYNWEPGIRSDKYREESENVLKNLNNPQLIKELEKARAFYLQGEFKKACEEDRALPRLKQRYRKIIFQVGKKTKSDVIDVQKQIPLTDNLEYFADYCHPLEKTNQLIVNQIKKILELNIFYKPLFQKLREIFRAAKANNKGAPSPDIYALG